MNNNSIFSEEEIVLAPPTELLDEAKEISLNTIHDEKFPFVLHYNPNQKNFLLSLLGALCAIIEENNEECHTISTWMNMTQLAFIKRSNCIERVKTDEGINPFLTEDADNLSADSTAGGVVQETIVVSPEAQNEIATPLSINATPEAITFDGSTASVAASVLNSCDSHPANTDMAHAQVIYANSTAEGCICCPGFEQWFKFTAPASKKYTICTFGDLDTIGTLYDCYGSQIIKIDDYEPCGKTNFRIIRNLTSGNTYYIKVGTYNNEVGSYTLRVTDSVLANSVDINKTSITLEKGVRYELPITPNYTYKGYMGAQRIPGLSVSISPSNANEQKIWWWEEHSDILECYTDWDDDGDRYFHVITKKAGVTKLYARDWKSHGKRDECSVTITPYCGGNNYRDVTKHSMILQSDGYYVCSKCGYKIKSPALQDKDILSPDDYIKMIALMHYYAQNILLAKEKPNSAYFYNSEAENCKIVMDTIRSQNQYASSYEYKGSNDKYLAVETNNTMLSFVSKSTIDALSIGTYNGFYETIASLVIGYCCSPMGDLIDVISLVTDMAAGEIDAISFGSFIAGLMDLNDIAIALSFFSSASDIIDCDVLIGDPVVRIAFSAYAFAEYVFDTNYNIKKVKIIYTT